MIMRNLIIRFIAWMTVTRSERRLFLRLVPRTGAKKQVNVW